MNNHIKSQKDNMVLLTRTFIESCKLAAMRDDKRIDRIEQKQIPKIEKAAARFIKELNRIN